MARGASVGREAEKVCKRGARCSSKLKDRKMGKDREAGKV